MSFDTLQLITIFFGIFFSSLLSGVIGMGGGTLLLSILSFFFPYHVLIPIHGTAQFFSNFFRSLFLWKFIEKKIFGFSLLGIIIGSYLSSFVIKTILLTQYASLFILFIILYALTSPQKLWKKTFLDRFFTQMFRSIHPNKSLFLKFFIIGQIVGFLGPIVGATGPILASFFLQSHLTKEKLVATKAAIQMTVHLFKIFIFLHLSFPFAKYSLIILLTIVGTVIASWLGTRLLKKINQAIFITLFKIFLSLAALKILYNLLTI